MTSELAKWLIGMREMHGWKQSELADRAGITRQEMNAMEKGRIALPGADKRRKLAAALGVRHVDLLVAIGELSEDEIDPRRQPAYPADEVRVLAERWHQFDADERRMITYILNTHLLLKGEEGVDNLVQSVDEPQPAFRRSVAG